MREKIEELLNKGEVDCVLALKNLKGYPLPWVFTKENLQELDELYLDNARYPLIKMFLHLYRKDPAKNWGVVVRGCEERALNELYKWNQVEPEKVKILGLACSQDLADMCECPEPFPSVIDYGEKANPVTESYRLKEIEDMSFSERLDYWLKNFDRCLKCFGCRDICPVCFCKECTLEDPDLIPAGTLPPDPTFHLVRAVHMAGRCIDCGLCEEICPAQIPLRTLYKEVGKIVEDLFDYRTGVPDGKSPLNLLGQPVEVEGAE